MNYQGVSKIISLVNTYERVNQGFGQNLYLLKNYYLVNCLIDLACNELISNLDRENNLPHCLFR